MCMSRGRPFGALCPACLACYAFCAVSACSVFGAGCVLGACCVFGASCVPGTCCILSACCACLGVPVRPSALGFRVVWSRPAQRGSQAAREAQDAYTRAGAVSRRCRDRGGCSGACLAAFGCSLPCLFVSFCAATDACLRAPIWSARSCAFVWSACSGALAWCSRFDVLIYRWRACSRQRLLVPGRRR